MVVAVLLAACGSSVQSAGSATASLPASASPIATTSPTATASPTATPAATPSPWRPVVGDTFQIQYQGIVDTTVDAIVFDLDGDDTPASTVAALHARGRHVLCYIDAGAWENYRADAASFPRSVLGKTMEDWPDERWLDIRRIDILAPVLRARLDRCVAKGFDGVDPDNVNGYTNATGFPLTAADQLRFNSWLADETHQRGLVIALKNDGDQAATLAPAFDAAVVEECVQYGECESYSPFIAAGKPVFDIEYSRAPSAFCPVAARLRFTIVGKRLALDAYRTHCPG
jgi:hypothetical protein